MKYLRYQVRSFITDLKSITRKDSFASNLAVLSGSKVVTIVSGFVFLPILTRIYNPEAYGLFALYDTTVSVIVLIASFSLTRAFNLPKNKEGFFHLRNASFISLLLVSIITLFVVLALGDVIVSRFDLQINSLYLLLLPLGILINGATSIFYNWNIREKQFRFSSYVDVSNNLSSRLLNLVIGLFTKGFSLGLIFGNQFGKMMALISNLSKYRKQQIFSIWAAKSSIKYISVNFMKYPRYIFPSYLVGMGRDRAIIYFVSIMFGPSILGSFAVAQTLLNIPIQLLGSSINTVYYRKTSDFLTDQSIDLKSITNRLNNRLIIIGSVTFSFVFVFGRSLFTLFLGKEWVQSGEIASIMSPMLYSYLISVSISPVLLIFKFERYIFRLTFISFTTMVLLLGATTLLGDFNISLWVFVAVNFLTNSLLITKVLKTLIIEPSYFFARFVGAYIIGVLLWSVIYEALISVELIKTL